MENKEKILSKLEEEIAKNMYKDKLEENEIYYSQLLISLKTLMSQEQTLLNDFNIDISTTPWFDNLKIFYVKDAFNYYYDFQNKDLNHNEINSLWFKERFNNFMIDVEKFICYFIKKIFNIKNIKFNEAIEKIKEVKLENYDIEEHLNKTNYLLNYWRKNFNVTKHNTDEIVKNYVVKKNKETKKTIITFINEDPLSLVVDYLSNILTPLLAILILHKEGKK